MDPLSMDAVNEMLDKSGLAASSVRRYKNTWQQWLRWCDDRGVHPGTAQNADVDVFLGQFQGTQRKNKKDTLSSIYAKARPEGVHPVQRNLPVTAYSQDRLDRQFEAWSRWCEKQGVEPLPADPQLMAEYLYMLAEKSYANTENTWRSIRRTSIAQGLSDPRRAEPVKQAIRTIRLARKNEPRPTARGSSGHHERAQRAIRRNWEKWCAEQGITPISATPSQVINFLEFKSDTWGMTAIIGNAYQLRSYFRTAGCTPNPAESQECRDYMLSLVSRYSRSMEEDRKQEKQAQRAAAKKQRLEEFYPVEAAECISHLASSTREKTMAQWREWSLWCDAIGVAPLHATPSEIVTFLTELADRIATSTVEQYCTAIAVTYEAAASDMMNPARHILVRNVLRRLHREKGQPCAQMTGLTDEDFARIEVTARRPKAWETGHQAYVRGTLDLALIGVMRDGLLRVGEAAALLWADLEEDDDGAGTLYIARSKTDQEGQGAVTYVSPQTMRYLRELRELRDPETDQAIIFYPDPATLHHRIRRCAQHAGLKGRYGGHSSRIGQAQDLALANFSMVQIMNAGRWRSPQMPAYYIRKLEAKRNAVARLYAHRPDLTDVTGDYSGAHGHSNTYISPALGSLTPAPSPARTA